MKKKKKVLNRLEAEKRAKKYIILVCIIGAIVAVLDFAMTPENNIEVEEAYGQLYLIRPEAGENSGAVSITAEIEGEEGTYEKEFDVLVNAYEKEEPTTANEQDEDMGISEEEHLNYNLRTIVDSINVDKAEKKVSLPDKLQSGEKIKWTVNEKRQSNTFLIIFSVLILVAIIYKTRFSTIKKKEEENRQSVLRQLPGFVNRLVLLLNAGLVLNSAFERAIEETRGAGYENDYFYQNMRQIYTTMKKANGSMNKEFKAFARKCGVQELMRISNIIDDNISKGTELTNKLQSEGEILWIARKKRCEELGKLAETKLTLPLMLFLLVLVAITIAPALLDL